MGKGRGRPILLAGSFLAGIGGSVLVLLLAPGRPWLLAAPLFAWGGLFFTWAWLRFKDPGYYG